MLNAINLEKECFCINKPNIPINANPDQVNRKMKLFPMKTSVIIIVEKGTTKAKYPPR